MRWLVEFVAYLMNRCDIGRDGKTALQRLHVRRDNTPILVFGEKDPVHARQTSDRRKVGALGLVIETRSANIRRVPESERWDADSILQMRVAPLSPRWQ